MTFWKWSKTAATNATADSTINWAEGQPPSSVNDSARAMMAAASKYRDDTAGTLLTSGSSTAYTVSTNQVFDTLAHLDGAKLKIRFDEANGAAATLAVDGLTAEPLQTASGVVVGAGVIAVNSVWDVTYDNSIPAFLLSAVPAQVQDNTVATASLKDSAVSYAKIQDVTDQRLLGNFSGGAAAPSEYALGAGLLVSGSTVSAPAFPPAAAFKNLSIKVASNTTVNVAADYVTTTDGSGNFQTTAVSSTVNLGTTGADALDTGTIAIDTWYAIWVIAKADGTTKCLASTSGTAPTMPSGYTYKARIGWVRTIHASATLYGTWQLGRVAQYVVGLAQTAALPIVISGSSGSTSTPTWTGTAVQASGSTGSGTLHIPSTAAVGRFYAWLAGTNAGAVMAAPNSSYGAIASSTNPPPIYSANSDNTKVQNVGIRGDFLMESTSVYYAANTTGCGLSVMGWEDNI